MDSEIVQYSRDMSKLLSSQIGQAIRRDQILHQKIQKATKYSELDARSLKEISVLLSSLK